MAAAVLLLLAPAILSSLRQGDSSTAPLNNVVGDYNPVEESAPAPAPQPDPKEEQARSVPPEPQHVAISSPTLREEQYAEMFDKWRVQITETSGRLGLSGPDAPTVQGAAAVSRLTDRLRSPLAASIESTLNVLRTALPSANAEKSQAKPQARVFHLHASGLA
jgi:hypothetical protein